MPCKPVQSPATTLAARDVSARSHAAGPRTPAAAAPNGHHRTHRDRFHDTGFTAKLLGNAHGNPRGHEVSGRHVLAGIPVRGTAHHRDVSAGTVSRTRPMIRKFLVFASLCTIASVASADGAGDPIVLRAGKSVVRVSELEARLAKLHPFEKASFGASDPEVKQAFLQRRLIPEVLAGEMAREEGIDQLPSTRARINAFLAETLTDSLQHDIALRLTENEVRAFCEAAPAPHDCQRDRFSYRVALAREKAHKELAEFREKLARQHVRGKAQALLERITVNQAGEVRELAPSEAEESSSQKKQ